MGSSHTPFPLDQPCLVALTLKRFVRVDKRHVELRPDSHNPEQQPIRLDLARHTLHIDGVAGGALIGRLGSAGQ